jgi:hypothetical protein
MVVKSSLLSATPVMGKPYSVMHTSYLITSTSARGTCTHACMHVSLLCVQTVLCHARKLRHHINVRARYVYACMHAFKQELIICVQTVLCHSCKLPHHMNVNVYTKCTCRHTYAYMHTNIYSVMHAS